MLTHIILYKTSMRLHVSAKNSLASEYKVAKANFKRNKEITLSQFVYLLVFLLDLLFFGYRTYRLETEL